MAYSDIQDKLGQIKMTNINKIYSQIPHVKGDLAVRQGDGGSPYTAPPKEDPTRKYVPAPPKKASLTQQQMDSLNKVFPGAEGRINKFRKKQFNMGPMQIRPQGAQLPDLAMDFNDAMGGGGFVGTTRTNVFINQGGEAYIREPNGNMKFDGMYNPELHGPVFPGMGLVQANDNMKIAAAPYSLNPQRIMLPSGQNEYAPINLRSDDQKERQHMMIYGGNWNKPIR